MTDAYQTSGTSPTVPVMNYEPLLNDEEAAVFLGGLHPKTVQRMARRGGIPHYRVESTTAIVLVSFRQSLDSRRARWPACWTRPSNRSTAP
jgi:hypothetical protein